MRREHEEIQKNNDRDYDSDGNRVLFPLRAAARESGRFGGGGGSSVDGGGGSSITGRDPALLRTVMALLPEASMAAR